MLKNQENYFCVEPLDYKSILDQPPVQLDMEFDALHSWCIDHWPDQSFVGLVSS